MSKPKVFHPMHVHGWGYTRELQRARELELASERADRKFTRVVLTLVVGGMAAIFLLPVLIH